MPRKPTKERVRGDYYQWLLGTRGGVYYADGRGNAPGLGRHSLGTRDRQEALAALRHLDLVKAVETGRADAALLGQDPDHLLPLEEGRRRYMDHVNRPAIQGGAAPATAKRYRPILDKFIAFAGRAGVRHWQQVTKHTLTHYGRWLVDEDYSGKTQYMELTVLKQALKWLVGEGLLPPASDIRLPLKKPHGTRTYCYTQAEVRTIVECCRADHRLGWLGVVVVALAVTGLRIGELAGLRWSDVDLDRRTLRLTDTTRSSRKSEQPDTRTTKSHRDRTLPLHDELLSVLRSLPRRPDNRVFHGPNGGKIKPDTVRNVLTRVVLPALAARFPATDGRRGIAAGRLHSFRHYFCSLSADTGVPEQMLMSWLGHRDSELIRHYYHQRDDEARRQMSNIPFLGQPPAPTSDGGRSTVE